MLGWMVLLAGVLSAVVLSGSVGYLVKGRSTAETGSSQARVIMLERGQKLLADQPVQGYGSGLAALQIGLLPGQRSLTIDSYFLTVAIESGYVGLGLFALGWLAVAARGALAGMKAAGVGSWVLITLVTAIVASLIVKTVLSLTNNLDLLYLFAGMSTVGVALCDRAAGALNKAPVRDRFAPAGAAANVSVTR